jgi:hypothetical protein
MGNPVYTSVEGCSCQANLVYEGTNSKRTRKHIKVGCYLKVTLVYKGLTATRGNWQQVTCSLALPRYWPRVNWY